jgi:RimJ/RimL family protein N-acetyltransferase
MLPTLGEIPLSYRRIRRADIGVVGTLELDPDQIERFLGPLTDIQEAVLRGPAHAMVAIEAADILVGFYVVHPDPRDGACWWLGWFAIDRRQQGRGYGSQAMSAALDRMRHIAGCRRIRLLVAPDNTHARLLYDRAGFCPVGRLASTGELVLELTLWSIVGADGRDAFVFAIVAAGVRRVFRHRRLRATVGPHAAWVIGVERGPPCIMRAAFGTGPLELCSVAEPVLHARRRTTHDSARRSRPRASTILQTCAKRSRPSRPRRDEASRVPMDLAMRVA